MGGCFHRRRYVGSYLNDNGRMPCLQSVDVSETAALVKVLSDIFAAVDQAVTLLGLLDLNAAFDCVDHDILLQRLQNKFGIGGQALIWIMSFLQDRTQQVFYKRGLSEVFQLLFGVPQGSMLGPLLFLLHVSELFDIVAEFGYTSHAYADDTQLYISVPAVLYQEAIERFVSCLERVHDWMASNRLRLNEGADHLAWYTASAYQESATDIDVTERNGAAVFNSCQQPRCFDRQSAYYGRSHCCHLPVQVLSAATVEINQTVAGAGYSKDASARLRHQSTRLL